MIIYLVSYIKKRIPILKRINKMFYCTRFILLPSVRKKFEQKLQIVIFRF